MSDDRAFKGQVSRSLAWTGAASSWVAVLDILVLVIILRPGWVSQAEYGKAELVLVLFPILDLATDLGLSAAIIQRDDHTPEALSTVFWVNVALSVLMLALLAFVGAPLLVALHGHVVVGAMLTAYGGKLILSNVYMIPQALLKKELRYKELAAVRSLANVGEFLGKVVFAALGFGAWCFFLGRLAHTIVTAIGIQICRPWRPRFVLRIRMSAEYLKYGLKASASKILFWCYSGADVHVVSVYFGAEAAGAFGLARRIVMDPVRHISYVVQEVAFPAFSALKHRPAALGEQLASFTRLNLVTVLPVVLFLGVAATDLLDVFWPNYAPAADALRVMCFVGVLRALSFVVPPLLDGVGRPGLTLVYSAVATFMVPGLMVVFSQLFGERLGYDAVAIAWAAGYPLAFGALLAMALICIRMPFRDYFGRVAGVLSCVLAAGLVAASVQVLLRPAPAAVRLVVTAATMLATTCLFLARFQGMTATAIRDALRK